MYCEICENKFKKQIDESVTKFGEYKKYKKQLIENKLLKRKLNFLKSGIKWKLFKKDI